MRLDEIAQELVYLKVSKNPTIRSGKYRVRSMTPLDGGYDVGIKAWADGLMFVPQRTSRELMFVTSNGRPITPDQAYKSFGDRNIAEDDPCWKGYKQLGMKKKDGKEVPNCIPENVEEYDVPDDIVEVYGYDQSDLNEAEYQGKKVELNKPKRGGSKKFYVYVKNDKGNVVKVNFGSPDMSIKKSDPEARKNFRARHNCSDKKDKTTAGYWSCRSWSDSEDWV